MSATLVDSLCLALEHHKQGRLDEAESLYRRVLARDPGQADAAFLLGQITIATQRVPEAAELFARAAQLAPGNPQFRAMLGEACRLVGRFDEARDAFFAALALRPDFVEPMFNLGLLFNETGRFEEALGCFRRAAELRSEAPRIQKALAASRKKARGAGKVAWPVGVTSAPTLVAIALEARARDDHEGAIALCRRALELKPRFLEALNLLGALQTELTLADEAIATFRRAIAISPANAATHANLGGALAGAGLIDEAVEATRKAYALLPGERTHSNLLFLMHFSPRVSAADILAEAREFQRVHCAPLAASIPEHDNDATPSRRLRVGYVSPDFSLHCQALFTVPTFPRHDRAQIELFAYSSVATPDTVTARLESAFEHWRNVHGLDDETLAAQIRRDRIDVLVDLTMHMAQGRPLLFARKPAPVQACWLAYPGTTGVAAIDARLSDPHLDPPGSDTSVHTEKTVCLADTFWCYDPQVGDVEVGPLPARARGGITFGCLNNPMKLNPDVLSLWGRVLREVAGSRLVVLAAPGSVARRIVDAIAAQGVDRDRVEIVKRRARPEYMTLYRDIDICLDTFPYGGHTTSLDAFWMGVPVVTLVGDRVVGRAGLSQATNLGMTDLVARTPDEYVDVARRWATDLERLEATRHGLRAKMQGSPLMDGARFARALEAAYRELWVGWCAERSVARRGR